MTNEERLKVYDAIRQAYKDMREVCDEYFDRMEESEQVAVDAIMNTSILAQAVFAQQK